MLPLHHAYRQTYLLMFVAAGVQVHVTVARQVSVRVCDFHIDRLTLEWFACMPWPPHSLCRTSHNPSGLTPQQIPPKPMIKLENFLSTLSEPG